MYGLQSTTLTNYGIAPVGWVVLCTRRLRDERAAAAGRPSAGCAARRCVARRCAAVCLSVCGPCGDACTRAACCRASLLPTTSILPVAFSTAATVAAAPPLASSEVRGGSQATTAAWPLAASKAQSCARTVALPWCQICCVCCSQGEHMCATMWTAVG